MEHGVFLAHQSLGLLAVHLVTDACRPDRLAIGVELEVVVSRLAVVGAHCVYLGLRFGPKPLAVSKSNAVRLFPPPKATTKGYFSRGAEEEKMKTPPH